MFRKISLLSAMAALIIGASFVSAKAQDAGVPALPEPIQNLVNEGAQIRYLGREHGFDAWITIKQGREQYFYVLPDRSAFLMGVLFDEKGNLVTLDQVQKLRGEGNELLDNLTSDFDETVMQTENYEFKSPSEQLYMDIENSNWLPLGQQGAPVAYAFIDPQCPHCHSFIQDLRNKNSFENGKIQLRMIPVGFKPETQAQAAYLLAAPAPQTRWFRHMDGEEDALPAKSEINQQGVQRNLAIMQSWKLSATPLIVYRGKNGKVKIVKGRPKDPDSLLADIGTRS